MRKCIWSIYVCLVITAGVLWFGASGVAAEQSTSQKTDSKRRVTQADREAAAERMNAQKAAAAGTITKTKKASSSSGPMKAATIQTAPTNNQATGFAAAQFAPLAAGAGLQVGANGYLIPDYFGSGNWAFSPPLRKFVDTLPGLGSSGANNLGNYIPVAVPEALPASGGAPESDYYVLALVEYSQKMHSDMPPTRLRGYVQLERPTIAGSSAHYPLTYPNGEAIRDANGQQLFAVDKPRYLGPLIISEKDRPVRVKFINKLPTGAAGNLFIPTDLTVMGAGPGPNAAWGTATPDILCKADPTTGVIPYDCFTQNRATLHLHGGLSPWISDGTPHQWITPAGELTPYVKGASVYNVPDMPNPGDGAGVDCTGPSGDFCGAQTFYWTNQQSARLLFYHDHASGLTRLNVYVGEAAGYLITDPTEQALINDGILPAEQIPLIIQDKSFVDATPLNDGTPTILRDDPAWNWGTGAQGAPDASGYSQKEPVTGDLWYPHVYSPAQNPQDASGFNAFGRWMYGPWFFPPTTGIAYPPVANPYYDCGSGGACAAPWEPSLMPGTPHPSAPGESFMDTAMVNGTAFPTVTLDPKSYRFRILNAANDRFFNLSLYLADSTVTSSDGRSNTEVQVVPAAITPGFPEKWPTDGRDGGVPNPAAIGPNWIQVGNESGFLPAPVVIPPLPTIYNADPTQFTVGNVVDHSLLLAPAERADVIVDFSAFAGKTLIVYNDAPAAFPARDARVDYYTGAPDLRDTGGHSGPQAGFGPNTRTVMQIVIRNTTPAPAYDLAALEARFSPTDGSSGVFAGSQNPIIVGQSAYDSAYNKTFPSVFPNWGKVNIDMWSLPFETVDGRLMTLPLQAKAMHDEMGAAFDEYGRMSTKLGLEISPPTALTQNFILRSYIDPPSEIISDSGSVNYPQPGDGTQIWRITHHGVDTHPIHFHLFDVQVINRVGWDNLMIPPDPNELGWKETVRISPLQDTIVALRPIAPSLPFGIPDSNRPLNPAMPLGATEGFSNIGADGNPIPAPITNQIMNFGWEYVWHCHILSHEEMDMMRPIFFSVAQVVPSAPALDSVTAPAVAPPAPLQINLIFHRNSTNEIGFQIQRSEALAGPFAVVGTALSNATSYIDRTVRQGRTYFYRVIAYNAEGNSLPSNVLSAATAARIPSAPANLVPAATATPSLRVNLTWSIADANLTGATIQRATNLGFTAGLTAFTLNAANPTSYADLTVSGNTTYYYRVAVTNSAGTSPYSASVIAVTPGVLAAPANLRTVLVVQRSGGSNNGRIILAWNASAGASGYQVWRSTNGGAFVQIGTTTLTTFQNSSLGAATYRYEVRATNGGALSPFSNILTVGIN